MSGDSPDPLEGIRYMTLEPGAQRTIGDFRVRPEIPLPVEVAGGAEALAAKGLSWEAIIAAMLKILAYDRAHRHADYFREFVLAVRPDIDRELTDAGIAKSRSKGNEIATEVFLSLEGLFPAEARHSVNLAIVYEGHAAQEMQLGHEEKADRLVDLTFHAYRRALESDPDLADAHLYLANFHLRQQGFDKAHAELKAYLALEPQEGAKTREARRLVKEIETRNLMDELFKAAYDFIRLGQEEKGIQKIELFLRANPEVWNGWFLLGWAHRRLRRYDEARSAFKRVLQIGERNADIWNELAICEMELGELGEARTCLEQALAFDTENVKVLSNLAVLSMREGNGSDARTYFQLVLDADPEDPVARSALERLSAKGSPQG